MFRPLPFFIGLRYTRAKRRNHFISFISLISMLGLTLGVMVMILVLSVMNGFDRELRTRILGMVPHATINGYQPISDWQSLAERFEQNPKVVGTAPFIQLQGMLTHNGSVAPVLVNGIEPQAEKRVSILENHMQSGSLDNLSAGEFGIVIGKTATRVSEADAMEHVLGYVCINDVSARDFQFADGQWQRGKSPDTFCPMGEAVVTRDEIADPHDLRVQLRLNGETMQDSSTKQLVFGVEALVSFLSQWTTLEPGDVIPTGTPPGVGFARKPPVYIQPGDVMEVEIEGLGILRNPVVACED